MQKLIVEGGRKLRGEIALQGSKNSSLPIMAAALLCGEECTLRNCPALTDVYAASRILNCVGCRCMFSGNTAVVDSSSLSGNEIPEELMREMRSSIIFMGAMLGRTGECTVSVPGGCELGPRPIDMHLVAMRKMGVDITDSGGKIVCRARKGRAKAPNCPSAFHR
jgi:UDP-N-acetylglucosamine 1-carboxyvinyltransferase